jgi:hypothetical protein
LPQAPLDLALCLRHVIETESSHNAKAPKCAAANHGKVHSRAHGIVCTRFPVVGKGAAEFLKLGLCEVTRKQPRIPRDQGWDGSSAVIESKKVVGTPAAAEKVVEGGSRVET